MLITPTPPGAALISEPSSNPLRHCSVVPLAMVRFSEVPWAIICHPVELSGSRGNPTPQGTSWLWEHYQSCPWLAAPSQGWRNSSKIPRLPGGAGSAKPTQGRADSRAGARDTVVYRFRLIYFPRIWVFPSHILAPPYPGMSG